VGLLGLIVQIRIQDSLSLDWAFEPENQRAIRLGAAITLGLLAILAVVVSRMSKTSLTSLRMMQDNHSEQATVVNLKRHLTRYSAKELERRTTSLRASIDKLIDMNDSNDQRTNEAVLGTIFSDLAQLEQIGTELENIAQDNDKSPIQHASSIDLPELLADTLLAFYPQFNARGSHVSVTRCGASVVQADAKRLKQVLHVLMQAALQSAQEKDEVKILCERTLVAISLRIHHAHYSCPEEDLSLCQSIINLHKGILSAHPSPDGGLAIIIMLPLQKTA
jgi:signal transduction histidine kinase